MHTVECKKLLLRRFLPVIIRAVSVRINCPWCPLSCILRSNSIFFVMAVSQKCVPFCENCIEWLGWNSLSYIHLTFLEMLKSERPTPSLAYDIHKKGRLWYDLLWKNHPKPVNLFTSTGCTKDFNNVHTLHPMKIFKCNNYM